MIFLAVCLYIYIVKLYTLYIYLDPPRGAKRMGPRVPFFASPERV